MTPPCHSFPASDLPLQTQLDVHGRRRKHDPSRSPTHKIDLSACQLFRMLQYKCHVQRPLSRSSTVQCFPVDRLFRRCEDKKGSFMVETTAWEGRDGGASDGVAGEAGSSGGDEAVRPCQWPTSWVDGDVAR